jgi:DUF438 domain-containing protein
VVLPVNNPLLVESLPFPVTICDTEGILIYMNSAAETLFAKDGGAALLGTNLYECHSPKSQEMIKTMMRERTGNTYTIEKAGKKRLIHQSPWYRDGEFAGLVEIAFEIPPSLPNFKRD